MYSRHNEVPAYQTQYVVVEAALFNRVQTALKRLGGEIRMMIPGLKRVDLILQRDAWIIVDRAFNDLPVAAWSEFFARRRTALHTPVPCRLKYYHANADLLVRRVLNPMGRLLDDRLSKFKRGHQVIHLIDRR